MSSEEVVDEGVRPRHPYRADEATGRARVEHLEHENAQLRRLVVSLVFALCVVAGGATWSLWTLWHAATR
jgi:hypothetical protein